MIDTQRNIGNGRYLPRPFAEVLKLWLQLGEMNEDFFKRELVHTFWLNTLLGVLVITGVTALFAFFKALLVRSIPFWNTPVVIQSHAFADTYARGFTRPNWLLFLVYPIIFYGSNGITFLVTRIFKGEGSFWTQTYLLSLIVVPISLLISIVSLFALVPYAGAYITYLLTLALEIWGFVLFIRAFKVVHDFTTGKAVAAALTGGIILVALFFCLLITRVI